MKLLIVTACMLMVGSLITDCAHASDWKQGTISDINRVLRLIVDGRAEMQGRLPDDWEWRCIDRNGCASVSIGAYVGIESSQLGESP